MFKDFTVSIVVPDNTPFTTADYKSMIERAIAELPGVIGVDEVSPVGEEKSKGVKSTKGVKNTLFAHGDISGGIISIDL